jgi:hypothetical protein
MRTPLLPHACFFHFSDTCSLGSNGSTKILVFDSFLEGQPKTSVRMLCPKKGQKSKFWAEIFKVDAMVAYVLVIKISDFFDFF